MPTLRLDGPVDYLATGGGPATPLLCLHGFTGSKDDFAAVLEGLAADRRAIAVDLPGHGGSAGFDDPAAYDLTRLGHWTLAFADALGLGEFLLLGHSHGGLVAQRVAAAASHRVRALVLTASGLGGVREEVADRYVRMATAARDGGTAAAYEVSLRASGDPDRARSSPGDPDRARSSPGDPDRARSSPGDPARDRFLALAPAAIVGGARNLVATVPPQAFLRSIDLPVLVVHGSDDDVWSPPEQRLLAATVRGARLVEIAGAGHSAHADRPRAWLEAVGPFLRAADRAGRGEGLHPGRSTR